MQDTARWPEERQRAYTQVTGIRPLIEPEWRHSDTERSLEADGRRSTWPGLRAITGPLATVTSGQSRLLTRTGVASSAALTAVRHTPSKLGLANVRLGTPYSCPSSSIRGSPKADRGAPSR